MEHEGARSALRRGLELLVLVGFAIAQPAFEVISQTPEFFVLRESSATEVILFALLMSLGIPAGLLGLELLVQIGSRRSADGLHLGLVAVLSAAFAMPLLERLGGDAIGVDGVPSGSLVLAVAGLLGATAALAHRRLRVVSTYLIALSPAPLAFLLLFLADAPTRPLDPPAAPAVAKPAPVVMLVFDELPVATLMDAGRRIDAERYPSFAALANNSTWYRRTTTVTDLTTSAVPAILTGSLPPAGTVPTASEQPRNLFALLRESHRLQATESFTDLCPAEACGGPGLSSVPRRTLALAADAIEIVAHAAAPPDLERSLGELDQGLDLDDASAPFERFTAGLRPTDRPQLHFIHMLLPHYPWIRLPSGRLYERAPPLDLPEGFTAGTSQRWDGAPWLARQGWQRHLLQAAHLDRMLGRLLRRLRALGVYDKALVVAVADHGVSFTAGQQMRDVTPSNVQDIAFVPLFIKAPGQRRGRIVDEPAQTTDVLPTMMEILGGRVPWQIEGRSLLARHRGPRPPVTVTSSRRAPVTTPAADLDRRFGDSLRRRIRIFGTGPRLTDREHHPEWIGRRPADPGVRLEGSATVHVDQSSELQRVTRASGFVPGRVTGEVREAVPLGRKLALTLNGRVAAVVPIVWTGTPRFSALLPERLFREGANSVEAFWSK